ncbi:MAG: NAD(P)H-dependent glycerol-3-phosphate dehydrogenase [Parvibaculales bacterium]
MTDHKDTTISVRTITKIGIVGGGAWGTALATIVARAGCEGVLWALEEDVVNAINTRQENPLFLPGIKLPDTVRATSQLADMADRQAILMVVPAQHLGSVLSELIPHLSPECGIALCAKGVERSSLRFMSEVAADHLEPGRLAVLSGPSFATDVAMGLPTAITLAANDPGFGESLAAALSQPGFRAYPSNDVIGAEIGGAVKNILAIACGIVQGKGLGDSARAALTARGFAEMTRLGDALGAKRETLAGLSGLGDLILTCSSTTSRNFSLGVALGEGQNIKDILGARNSVSEGALSAQAVKSLAAEHQLDMPISQAIADIVDGRLGVDEAIVQLLARPVTGEG